MATPQPEMPYVRLGTSGLKVSRIILGCMSYGDPEWSGKLGCRKYSARAIKAHNLPRDEIVIMTKVFFAVSKKNTNESLWITTPDLDGAGYVNQYGLSRKHIFDSVAASLRRLGLDYIDVLQCHRFDPNTPIEETMQALHDVVKAGHVRYVGMSSCYAYQYYAITNKLTPFISMQNHYSLLYREEEREMVPTLKHFGVGSIPWSAIARGALARPLTQQSNRVDMDVCVRYYLFVDSALEEIAKKRGISMAQLAVAWALCNDSAFSSEIIASAVNVKLTEEERKYLEEPYKPQAIFGH
ncbi:NADP-dependent oxidoreductase domain-containing protein [Mycena olivaceomarginata]|nr:NADP-dependent oxidoreductase domain-containing protein [Mycena olivaceomarginata]